MKRVISALTALVLAAMMGLNVFALDVVGSAEIKPTPPLVPTKEGYVAVLIETQSGEIIEYLLPYTQGGENTDLTFALLSIAEKDKAPVEEMKKEMEDANDEIRAAKSIASLTPNLEKQVQKQIDLYCQGTTRKIDIGNLIFSDLLAAELIRDAISMEDLPKGSRCSFVIDPSFDQDKFFVVLHQDRDGDWEVVDNLTWTEEGNLKFSVDELGPFAILLEKSGDPVDPNPPSPQTDDPQGINMLYFLLAGVFVVAAAIFFVKAAKKRED